MENQDTPLGRFGYLVIPIGIALAITFPLHVAALIAAVLGLCIASVRAIMFVRKFRDSMSHNPLMQLQANVMEAGTSTQIRYIIVQSVIGAIVLSVWTAIASGLVYLFAMYLYA